MKIFVGWFRREHPVYDKARQQVFQWPRKYPGCDSIIDAPAEVVEHPQGIVRDHTSNSEA